MVSSPTNTFKPILPRLNIGGTRGADYKSYGLNDLKGLKSDVFYVNSPQAKYPDTMMSPVSLLPNSCRINMEKRGDQYPYPYIATERKVYGGGEPMNFAFGSARNGSARFGSARNSNIPDDEPIAISKGDIGKKKSARNKNPFFRPVLENEL